MMTESKQNVSPDWRGLCEELTEFVARLTKHYYEPAELLIRARAALAQPEAEVVGPMQLPEQSPDEHPPSNLDRREVAAWYHGHACGWQAARAIIARWGRPAPAPAGDSTLRDAARLALTTLEGWANYDQWVWPISAMEQAKRGTTEALAALKAALDLPASAPAEKLIQAYQAGRRDAEADAQQAAEAAEDDPIENTNDPMIPSRYTGYQVDIYRDGFQSGYKHGLNRASIAAELEGINKN